MVFLVLYLICSLTTAKHWFAREDLALLLHLPNLCNISCTSASHDQPCLHDHSCLPLDSWALCPFTSMCDSTRHLSFRLWQRNAHNSIFLLSNHKVTSKKSPLTRARKGCSAPVITSAVHSPSCKASDPTFRQPMAAAFPEIHWLPPNMAIHGTATCRQSGFFSWTFPYRSFSVWGRTAWVCPRDFLSRETCIWAKNHPDCSNHLIVVSFHSLLMNDVYYLYTELLSLPTLVPSCFPFTLCFCTPSLFFVFLG